MRLMGKHDCDAITSLAARKKIAWFVACRRAPLVRCAPLCLTPFDHDKAYPSPRFANAPTNRPSEVAVNVVGNRVRRPQIPSLCINAKDGYAYTACARLGVQQ